MKSKFYRLNILRIILLIGYYLWTMSSYLRIKFIENDLSLILNRWRNLKVEDSIQIDMDYIEKLSKQFNEKELSAEEIEL